MPPVVFGFAPSTCLPGRALPCRAEVAGRGCSEQKSDALRAGQISEPRLVGHIAPEWWREMSSLLHEYFQDFVSFLQF